MPDDGEKELKVLFPGTDVKVGGETLTVTPLKFTQWLKAAKLTRPFVDAFNKAGLIRLVRDKDARGNSTLSLGFAEDNIGGRIIQLVAEGEEALVEFMAFAVGKKVEWLDTLEGDEGLILAEAIYKENTSFFAERMMPIITRMMGAANPLTSETSSPDSSKQDIASTPSKATPEIK